jgi:primase-polymerase (primpol)-like protein
MSIPQELVPYRNFVCRGLDPPDANGNRQKPPYNARTGIRCDVGDPDNLSDLQTALNTCQSNPQKYVGIGFAPEGTDIVGVDGDTYKTQDPRHIELFAEIHRRFGAKTFGEKSPQGGFHGVAPFGETNS